MHLLQTPRGLHAMGLALEHAQGTSPRLLVACQVSWVPRLGALQVRLLQQMRRPQRLQQLSLVLR